MFGSEPFAGTTTERPIGMIPAGRSPWRPVRGWSSRVLRPGRVVAHQDLHVVPAGAERARLVLGVLDDPAPVRPGEGDDDADLHAWAASSAGASRSIPASSVSSVTASERRAQPAPLGPKPSPGATATRCSTSSRSGVRPSGSRSQT